MKLFSLEGIDGSGKSTQQKYVGELLTNSGVETMLPTSPSRQALGNFIRREVLDLDPWLRNKLFLLDIEFTNRTAKKLGTAAVVLWDRYTDSFYASNPEMDIATSIDITSHLSPPAKTFLLDVPLDVILKKRKEAHDNHTIPEWLEFKQARYYEIANLNAERIEIIDGTKDIEVIGQYIFRTILNGIQDD